MLTCDRVRVNLARILLRAACTTLVVSTAQAQQGEVDHYPPNVGQWSGPWDLKSDMVNLPDSSTPYAPDVNEIAHSIVLPPASAALAENSAFGGWVVFMNRRSSATPQQLTNPQPTYLWNPNQPSDVQLHLNVPGNLSKDIFCSGHTFLGDGRPVTAGGQDMVSPPPLGAGQSYVLRTDLAINSATPPSWQAYANQATERWYPTVTTLADGTLLQTGNSPSPCATHDCGDDFRQRLDLSGPSPVWMPDLTNQRFVGVSGCDVAPTKQVLHYPRLHLLTSGSLMWVDGEETAATGRHVAWFLKVNPTLPWDCTALPGNPYQWREGAPAVGDTAVASQKGGPTVQLLWPDSNQSDGWAEVVYQFGGTIEPEDDTSGCPPVPLPTASPTNRVARMVNPAETVPWDLSLEPMHYGRMNHNAVLLLDGSVLIVGGLDSLPSGCVFRTTPERFKPPEVFGGPGGMTWKDMAEQIGERNYHSVAGLLPDGRAFSAGGSDPENKYTVELYNPPYMFWTPRPVILTTFPGVLHHSNDLVFDVKMRGGGEVERVALVRIGSATHAFDMSQRYITLAQSQAPEYLGNDVWRVHATVPPNGYVAPPSWYMLTAIGGLQHTPSAAKWIKVE